jgi:hypothetical protein
MNRSLRVKIQEAQPKLHGLAAGMTLAVASTALSQGCPLVGQCASCAACLPRLPLLAVPLVADALVVLAGKVMQRRADAMDGAGVSGEPGI